MDTPGDTRPDDLPLDELHIAAIKEALAEADAGAPMVSNEKVMAWLESWETPDELPPPEPDIHRPPQR